MGSGMISGGGLVNGVLEDAFTILLFFLSKVFLYSIVISKGHFSVGGGDGVGIEVMSSVVRVGIGIGMAEIGSTKMGGSIYWSYWRFLLVGESVSWFSWGAASLVGLVVSSVRVALVDDWATSVVVHGLRIDTADVMELESRFDMLYIRIGGSNLTFVAVKPGLDR